MTGTVSRRTLLAGSFAATVAAMLPRDASGYAAGAPALTPLPDPVREGALVWDVAPVGYVADEFILSGTADVLESVSMADAVDMSKRDAKADLARRDFRRSVVAPAAPYATRIIVYRPADPKRFSGRVLLEVLHPGGGGNAIVWGMCHDMLAERGDAYVGVQPPLTIEGLKRASPERYGPLHAQHPTQLWGAVIDAARLARGTNAASLFGGRPVRRIVLAGYSYTGVATANFANFHHDLARAPGGAPLIDGYLPMASATFVRPLDVPVIRLNTQSDFSGFGGLSSRSPDSDARIGRSRHYELAGASHVTQPFPSPLKPPASRLPEAGGLPHFSAATCYAGFPAGSRPNDYPVHIVADAAIANMFDWIDHGRVPPRAPLIEVDARGATRTDADGNAVGGLRLPPVSVPVATYGTGEGPCQLFGFTAPFADARKRALHGSKTAYLGKAADAARKLRRQGFILASGESTLLAMAEAVPEFRTA